VILQYLAHALNARVRRIIPACIQAPADNHEDLPQAFHAGKRIVSIAATIQPRPQLA